MSIFAVEESHPVIDKNSRYTKPERFRLEIRRKQQDEKFRAIRQQFVQSLKSLSFLQNLKSEKDNLTAKKIAWLVEGLQGGLNNASFYQDILDMQLEPYLCEVILNDEISLENKTKILKSLVQLTYYSGHIPKQLIENNLIDFFRVMLNKLKLEYELQQDFAYYVTSLVMNLTSFMDQQFNGHMMESDFLPTIQNAIDRSPLGDNQEFMRQNLLKIYKNLFMSQVIEVNYVPKILLKILNDEKNSETQSIMCCTLECILQASKIPNFWTELLSQIKHHGQICQNILSLSYIIDENFNENAFRLFIQFLIVFSEDNNPLVVQELNNYINALSEFSFFHRCFLKLLKNQQSKKTKKIIFKVVKLYSKLNQLFHIVYQDTTERQELLEGIMQRYIATNALSQRYLARVLSKLLDEDKTTIDILINNGIIDLVRDLLDGECRNDEKVDVIELVQRLIFIEEELRDRTQGENKMVNVFVDRGIVRDIEKLQEHPNREVYQRAETFMVRLSELSQSSDRK